MARMREHSLMLRLLENHLPTTMDMVVTGQIEDTEAIIDWDMGTEITIMGQDIDSEVTIIGFQIGDIERKRKK